jgi:ATP-binding cassette, subfamily B, bacterial PglK
MQAIPPKKSSEGLMNINTIKSFFTKKYFFYFIILEALLILVTLLELTGIGLVPLFISLFIDISLLQKYLPLQLYNYIVTNFNSDNLILYGSILLFTVFFLKNLIIISYEYIQANIIKNIRLNVTLRVFSNYLDKDYQFFIYSSKPDIIRTLTSDVSKTISFFTELIKLSKETIFCIGLFIFVYLLNPYLAIGSISILSLLIFTFYNLVKKKLQKLGQLINFQLEQQYKVINESVDSIKEIIMMEKQSNIKNIFEKKINDVEKNIFINQFIHAFIKPVVEIVSVLAILLVSFYFVLNNYEMKLLMPILGLTGVIVIRLTPTFNGISRSLSTAVYLYPAFENIVKKLNYNSQYPRGKQEKNIEFESISFEDVSFSYDGNTNKTILNNINFKILKGEKFGIYGPSGSGKSTILDLFSGLLDPSDGQILLNNKIDLAECKLSWRKKIGYAPQFNCFLDDTLEENITFFEDRKLINRNSLDRSIIQSNLQSLVKRNSDGLEFKIGEKGIRLSGGEKQRLSIARSIYTQPEIIILDETTSSLDEKTETKILSDLNKNFSEKTIIVISHKLKIFNFCDNIICLNNGKIENILNKKNFFEKFS